MHWSLGCGFRDAIDAHLAAAPGLRGRNTELALMTSGDAEADPEVAREYGFDCPIRLEDGSDQVDGFRGVGSPAFSATRAWLTGATRRVSAVVRRCAGPSTLVPEACDALITGSTFRRHEVEAGFATIAKGMEIVRARARAPPATGGWTIDVAMPSERSDGSAGWRQPYPPMITR